MFTKNISERPITSKKKLILAILAITAISGTTALGIDKASANTNSDITLVQIIAQKFNLSIEQLKAINNLENNPIRPGQTLLVSN